MAWRNVPALFVIAACSADSTPPASNPAPAPAADAASAPAIDASAPSPDAALSETGAADTSFADPLAGSPTVTKVNDGYAFTEGPLWRAATQDLLFSDIGNDKIERFAPPSTFATFRDPSGRSNGLAFDNAGLLIACEGGNRRVTRTLAAGGVEVVAERWDSKKLNAPNDVIVRSDGNLYFTDPDYSVDGVKELTFNGVFRVSASGTMSLVADDLAKPNGIALSPDQNTLYVADEGGGFIRTYAVAADGSTSSPQKLADVAHPDGFTVDDAGNLYVAGETAIVVLRPDGTVRGSLPVEKRPTNCAFGGPDRKTLFITAQDSLYKVELGVPGPP